MKFELYVDEHGNRRVRFEDGDTAIIQKDGEGREFFYVKNRNPKAPLGLFADRIKDAIDAIRDGYGHALSLGGLFGSPTERVHYFLDESYGETLRKRTIEGFKDAVFGYSLKFGFINMFSGLRLVGEDKSVLGVGDSRNPIFFETEMEAESYRDDVISSAKLLLQQYEEALANGDEMAIKRLIDMHGKSVVFDVMFGMSVEDINEVGKWRLEVVQTIKPVARVMQAL